MADTEPAARRPRRRTTIANPGDGLLEVIAVRRREPFGENPVVGARGARTQQRILPAALQVFGEVRYHACRVERITEAAHCSRPTFYQYFDSKEDLFRQLAGEVARELYRIADAMEPVTPDVAGWHGLRAWLDATADIYEACWPVMTAYYAAEGSDDLVASGAIRVGRPQSRSLSKKIDASASRAAPPEVVTFMLTNGVNRAHRYRQFLLGTDPERAPDRDRMLDCLAEIL